MNTILFDRAWRFRALLIVVGFLAIPLIGILDYFTGFQLSYAIFYLVPISVVTWFSETKAGVFASVASAVTWLVAELIWREPYSYTSFPYWNTILRLGLFLFVVFIIMTVKSANERLEVRVQERTVVLTQEIEKRKQAEDVLRENEELFSSAFEYAPIGMALVAQDGRFIKANNALCNIVGYSDQELLAKTFQDITHPDDLEADLAFLHQLVVREIRTYQIKKRYFHKSGQVVWVQLNVSLIHDAQGKSLYFISQIQDITQRKQAEEELIIANKELVFQN